MTKNHYFILSEVSPALESTHSGLILSLSLSYHFYSDDLQICTSLNHSDIETHIQAVLKLEQGVKEIGK